MIKYKTYCKEIPKTFYGIKESGCNKPLGGLWGCRGDEWKEWCEGERFALDKLKKCFTWRLKKGTKVYRIRTVKDFEELVYKYPLILNGIPTSIDFKKLAEEYDAVEVIGDIVWKLRFGSGGKVSEKYFLIKSMGLYSWDVPSICVMNPEKVVVL